MSTKTLVVSLILLACGTLMAGAQDWPTFRRDYRRSGVTAERLNAPALQPQWTHRASFRPDPAWPVPARWDAYNVVHDLKSMRNYDPVYHVTAVGDRVAFGSSTDDAVWCLDAGSGRCHWRFVTDGPVRIAPTWDGGRLYFGSDDGFAYCVRADDGKLIWKHKLSAEETGTVEVLHNGKSISLWPVRTGVCVDGGLAYFGASMFPWSRSYLAAVDAQTCLGDKSRGFLRTYDGQTMEGAALITATELMLPQGRVPPIRFSRRDGAALGKLVGGGGCFVLLADDGRINYGPGNKGGWIDEVRPETPKEVVRADGANSMVIAGELSYILSSDSLKAVNRVRRQELWRRPTTCSLELILAGDTLFAGGVDEVQAFSVTDGHMVWRGKVQGRAYGLVVANGALYVSTDEGFIHCFRAGRAPVVPLPAPAVAGLEGQTTATGTAVTEPDMLSQWLFNRQSLRDRTGKPILTAEFASARVINQVGAAPAIIDGRSRIESAGKFEAMPVTPWGLSINVSTGPESPLLVRGRLSVEAWVNIEEVAQRGAIAGCLEDKGTHQSGWVLGHINDRFAFSVATGNAGHLQPILSSSPMVLGKWHHVAGTWDGAMMRLYVDGAEVASGRGPEGEIEYSKKSMMSLCGLRAGGYTFRGAVSEVRLYSRELTAERVLQHFRQRRDDIPATLPIMELASGPLLRFDRPGEALICWRTPEPSPTLLEYGLDGGTTRIEDATARTEHAVRLSSLRPSRVYAYRILMRYGNNSGRTVWHECDTHFDFNLLPFPAKADPFADAADRAAAVRMAADILSASGLTSKVGLCLIVGAQHGPVAWEIARTSQLRVLIVDADENKVRGLRARLFDAGVYGPRLKARHVESIDSMPMPDGSYDLILADQGTVGKATMLRLARPDGGMTLVAGAASPGTRPAAFDRVVVSSMGSVSAGGYTLTRTTRGALPGSAPWSHQYGVPGNSGFAGEELGGAYDTGRMRPQWIGEPGPRYQADRGPRKSAPLAIGGRLFMQGLNRIITVDSHNGSVLWEAEMPGFHRYNVPRDCGNWCADEKSLYLAFNEECVKLDTVTGSITARMPVPPPKGSTGRWDWGYIARCDNLLLGSAVRHGAAFSNWWGPYAWYDGRDGAATAKVCSDNLFALDAATGKERWTYQGGLIVNSTITVGDGRAYFVEADDVVLKAGDARQLNSATFWNSLRLVALNLKTGDVIWRRPIAIRPAVTALFLVHAEKSLVLVGSGTGRYSIHTFAPADGADVWNREVPWEADNHGKHMIHPTVVGGKLFVRPAVLALADGKPLDAKYPDGHQCGSYTAAAGAIVMRAGGLTLWGTESGSVSSWSRLRPDCWISTIPANGMILAPEGGGGCSCGSWMEMSAGFVPTGN